jgi:hypothetical protein
MTCEPGPGLGDRRRWRADPGACPAAGGELAQVQHQVRLGRPDTGTPRPGCAEEGPSPVPRNPVSRRFRSAPHSGVATAQKHPHDSGPSVRVQRSSRPASECSASSRRGGLFGFLVWARGTPQPAGAPAGPRARAAALDAQLVLDPSGQRAIIHRHPGTTACCSARPGWVGMLDRCR